MKLNDLELFVDICEFGGLTQTAVARGTSQPGISRRLRDIETTMRANLVRRTGRGVELTDAGEHFLSFCKTTIKGFRETQKQIDYVARTDPEELSVAIPLQLSRLIVPSLQRELERAFPETNVIIREESSEATAHLLHNGTVEAAICYVPEAYAPAPAHPTYREGMYLVGGASVTPPEKDVVSIAEISGFPLMLPHSSWYRKHLESAFEAAGERLTTVRDLETASAMLAFAMEAEGMTILPYSNIYEEVERGEVWCREIADISVSRNIYIRFSNTISKWAMSRLNAASKQGLALTASKARWKKVADTASV